jgi:hypothetical protein
MIGVLFVLALQAADGSQAPAPAEHNAADAIADILARTPPDGPPAPAVPAQTPAAPPAAAPSSVAAAPTGSAAFPAVSAPADRAQRYESSLRASFQAREARQGDLDGRWTLTDVDGKALYIFQLADPGPGRGPVEGAWRDLGRTDGARTSGFIDAAARSGRSLTVNFQDAGPCTVTLTEGADGRWTGQIKVGDKTQAVVMGRA